MKHNNKHPENKKASRSALGELLFTKECDYL